jgi:hypothetical protein
LARLESFPGCEQEDLAFCFRELLEAGADPVGEPVVGGV